MHDYQRPDASMTLREGLAEYFASDPTLTNPDDCGPEGAELFRRHDAVHIVFGTNRDLQQEALTDAWTAFGTDAPWSVFREYMQVPEVRAVFSEIGWAKSLAGSVLAAPNVWRVWRRARRMKARWPFAAYAEHYDEPLCDIRARYGVRVLPLP